MCLLIDPLPATSMELPKDFEKQQSSLASEDKSLSSLYETDEFRLYCFKVLPCSKRATHNWQTCVFAHWGEKARRRDIRTHNYSSQLCPDVKRCPGGCPRGDACHMSHNIFESWLHPELYRTQLCTSGSKCNRTVCFFAHSVSELRTPTKAAFKMPSTTAPVPAAAGTGAEPPLMAQQDLEHLLLTSHDSTAAAAAAAGALYNSPGHAAAQVSPTPSAALSGISQLDASPRIFEAAVVGSSAASSPGPIILPQQQQQQQSPCSNLVPQVSGAGLLLLPASNTICNTSTLLAQQQLLPSASPAASLDSGNCIVWPQQQPQKQQPCLVNTVVTAGLPTSACFVASDTHQMLAVSGDMLGLQVPAAGMAPSERTSSLATSSAGGLLMQQQHQDDLQQQQLLQLQQQLLMLQRQELQLQQALLLQQQLQGLQLAQHPVAVTVDVPASFAMQQQYTLLN